MTVNLTGTNTITLSDYSPTLTSITSSGLTTAYGSGHLMSAGDGTSMWADLKINDNLSGSHLSVRGDATFEGDVKIKGKSIADSLERIEERLAILRPNDELEEKWENLRALRNAYRELEAEIIEKQEIWSILKK